MVQAAQLTFTADDTKTRTLGSHSSGEVSFSRAELRKRTPRLATTLKPMADPRVMSPKQQAFKSAAQIRHEKQNK